MIKKFLAILLLSLSIIACGTIKINFKTPTSGDVLINMEIPVGLDTEDHISSEIDIWAKKMPDSNWKLVKKDNQILYYEIKSKFSNLEEFKKIFDSDKYGVSIIEKNGKVYVHMGNTQLFKYEIKVNGKIIDNPNHAEIKGKNTILFKENSNIEFSYKKRINLIYIVGAALICCIAISGVSFIVYNKNNRKKGKIDE